MAKEILEYVLIPLLIILTRYLIVFIDAKRKELKEKVNNDLADKYIDMIYTTVSNCVIATNQTYVDTLKAQGNFNKEAQIVAYKDIIQLYEKGKRKYEGLLSDEQDQLYSICKELKKYGKQSQKS